MKRTQFASPRPEYKPAKSWRLRQVAAVITSHGAYRVDFADGFTIQVHSGDGRNDRLYAMRPNDTRLERRSPGQDARREYQYAALKAVLLDHPADFFVDADGDVVATFEPETVMAEDILRWVKK